MKVCTCLLLCRIFAFTNSVPQLDERSRATKNLDNDHNNFKEKINDKNKNLKLVFRAPKVESFIDFIEETIDILNIFEDDAFEEFFFILDNEIRNYHYKGCKFSEITENRDTRNLLTRTLKTIRWKPVTFTKANINEMADKLRDETYDNSVKELLNYINALYKNSKKKFLGFLNNLNHYRKSKSVKTHQNLVQVIRDGVRSILFNHYTELDANDRRELITRIETFWAKFKTTPKSNAQINNVETDPVHESRIKSFDDSENIMNKVKEPELHFKQDPQKNLKNKVEKIGSKKAYDDHSKDQEVEDDLSSNESEQQATDYSAEELSSRQSFDSSSNSIKLSQERQEEYNTQRYMTLYTEEIAYKARTTQETEITPMSKIVMTKRHRDQRRPTTTPRYRPRDVMKKMLRTNQEMGDKKQYIDANLRHDTHEPRVLPLVRAPQSAQRLEPRKPDKTRSKSRHKKAQLISKYDAVIDVRLDNADFLESLRMFAPAETATKHDISPYQMFAAQRRTKPEIKPQSPTAPKKSLLKHSTTFESHHINPQYIMNKKTKTKSPTRRSGNDTKDFNEYVMKRIDALENDIKELKQMNIIPMVHENNTNDIQVSNFTAQRKDMKGIDIERLFNTNQNIDNKEVIKGNNTEHNANSNENNTNSSITKNNMSANPDTINNDIVNATVIENKTTTQAIDSNTNTTATEAEEISEEVTTDRTFDITDTTTVESDDTTPASDGTTPASDGTTPASDGTTPASDGTTPASDGTTAPSDDTTPTTDIPRRTMAFSQPMYDDYPDRRLDPFDHKYDGLDLNM